MDRVRAEEQWTARSEGLLNRWMGDWKRQAKTHDASSKKKKKYSNYIMLPCTIFPAVLATLTSCKVLPDNHIFVILGLVTTTFLNSIQVVMRFDSTSEKHAQIACRYQDLICDVEEILSKERLYRTDPDVFISSIKNRSEALLLNAPDTTCNELESDSDGDNSLLIRKGVYC